jgi:hypothetical protein
LDLEFETKKECVGRIPTIGKFMYHLGCLSLSQKGSTTTTHYRRKRKLVAYIRRLHPIGFAIILTMLICNGINKQTFKEIKDDTVWW